MADSDGVDELSPDCGRCEAAVTVLWFVLWRNAPGSPTRAVVRRSEAADGANVLGVRARAEASRVR